MSYGDAVRELAKRKDLCAWLAGRREGYAYEVLSLAQDEGRYGIAILSAASGKPRDAVMGDVAAELERMRGDGEALSGGRVTRKLR